MVHYRRHIIPGATTFFTVKLEDRHATWLTTHITALREAFRKTRAEHPFKIDAIVILPNHLNALLTLPEDDADYPHRWRRIKSLFTRAVLHSGAQLPTRDHTGRTLWQRRYWEHLIRDETDLANHITYIHNNPVRHGLVSHPQDWPHSSLHQHLRQSQPNHPP
jgi:putative transposase